MQLAEMQKHVYIAKKAQRGEWNKENIQVIKLWEVSPSDKNHCSSYICVKQ